MKYLIAMLALLTFSVSADQIRVVVSWTDSTPTGSAYVPQWEMECDVDGVLTEQENNMIGPLFSVDMDIAPTAVLVCRGRNTNIIVSALPILGDWSPDMPGVPATDPNDPSVPVMVVIPQ